MAEEVPIHPLERFPRRDLSIGISRRKFFMTIAAEFALRANQSLGANAVRIPALGNMPDRDLMDFVPRILPDCQIDIRGTEVWGRLEHWSAPNFLFHLDELSSFCFNQMNGQNTLETVARAVAEETGLPFERAFALTRGMFLTLVQAGVCLPVDNPLLG
jgi:hypothetical protein